MKNLYSQNQNAELSAKFLFNEAPKGDGHKEEPKKEEKKDEKKPEAKSSKVEAKKDIHGKISGVVGKLGYAAEVGEVGRMLFRGGKRVNNVPAVGTPLRVVPGTLEKISSFGIGTLKGVITGVATGVSEGVSRVVGGALTAVKNGAKAGYNTAKKDITDKIGADKKDTKAMKEKIDARRKVSKAERQARKANKNVKEVKQEVKKAA